MSHLCLSLDPIECVFMQNSLMKITYSEMIVNRHKCLHVTAIEADHCGNESKFHANVK